MSQTEEAKHTPLSAFITYMAVFFVFASILLRPLVPGDGLGFGVNLVFHVLVLTGIVCWVLLFLLDQHVILIRSRAEVPILVFLAFLVGSPFVAQGQERAFAQAAGWAADLALFYLVFNIAVHRRLRRLLFRTAIGAAVAVSLIAIDQHQTGLDETRAYVADHPEIIASMDPDARALFLERLASDRPFATMVLATMLGGYLILFLPAAAGQVVDRLRQRQGAWHLPLVADLAAIGILGYCLFLTRTRGAFLALGVGLIVFGVLSARDLVRNKVALAVTVLVLLALGGGLWSAWNDGTFGDDPVEEARRSMDYRFGYWEGARGVLGAHLLTGVGADNLRYHYYRYKPAWASEAVHAHNSWLQMGAELGAIGLGAFVLVWLALLRAMATAPREDPDQITPPAANHFAPLPFESSALWGLSVFGGIFAFLVYGALVKVFDLAPTDLVGAVMLVALAYVLVDRYGAASGAADDTFRRRGLVAGLVAGLVHAVVDVGFYHAQVDQALWVVAGLAVASYRPIGATGDIAMIRIPLLAPSMPAAPTSGSEKKKQKKKKGKESKADLAPVAAPDGFLLKLIVALVAILVPWGLFIFKVMIPRFQASAFSAWSEQSLEAARAARAEAEDMGSTKDAADKRYEATRLESDAAHYMEKVLELDADHLEARMMLGRQASARWQGKTKSYRDLDKHHATFETAREHLEAVAEDIPGYAPVWKNLYVLYWHRGTLRLGAPARAEAEGGGIRARRDPIFVENVKEGWDDVRRAIDCLEMALVWYPTQARNLLESGRALRRLAALEPAAREVVPDLPALGFDPEARATERFQAAIDCSEAAMRVHDRLTGAELEEARAALEAATPPE